LTTSKELEAKILRFYFVEQWRVGTIAAQLGIHHSTVNRILAQAGQPKVKRTLRPSKIDPYVPFILDTLNKYPKLTAARLHAMAKERGYQGGPSHFRDRISELRPRPLPEAFLRLKTMRGEEGQADWAVFEDIHIGKAKRPLVAFVMTLSWSRQIFLQFYLNMQMSNFLRGHVAAFEFWDGVTKIIKYDNLRSAVLERRDNAIRFHPTLLNLAAHYRFEPRPVAVARGNEKGRVERSIRFIRGAFFEGREWQGLDDLNAQAIAWCRGESANRRCPEDPSLTVREAFEQERSTLLSLPDNPFPTEERVEVSVGKTPYVRFDLNDYSIPHTHVRRVLTVVASQTTVRVLADNDVIASHSRCYGKGEQIEEDAHIEALIEAKRQARYHRGQDRLAHAVPESRELLQQAVQRGHRPTTTVALLLELLNHYGATELNIAVREALEQHAPHPNGVRLILERRRENRQQPPPIAIALPNHPKVKGLVVRLASLDLYDQLNEDEDNHDQQTHGDTATDSNKDAEKYFADTTANEEIPNDENL